jgi:glycolate oxidase iron-sulfur subunit
VLLLEGCVQPGLSPNTNDATARVLDRLGISVTPVAEAGCCGALDYHLDAQAKGLDRARQNIDAWWPQLENGAEAIVQTASGCGAFIKDYGHLLAQDRATPTRRGRSVSERWIWCNCSLRNRWSKCAPPASGGSPCIAPAHCNMR